MVSGHSLCFSQRKREQWELFLLIFLISKYIELSISLYFMYDNDGIFIRVRITLIIIYIFVWNPADDLNTSFIGSLETCVYGPPLSQPIFMMHGVTWTEKRKKNIRSWRKEEQDNKEESLKIRRNITKKRKLRRWVVLRVHE